MALRPEGRPWRLDGETLRRWDGLSGALRDWCME